MQNELEITDSFLYGKAAGPNSQRIVSIEIQDEFAELFIQQKDGSIKSVKEQNRFWLLTNKDPGGWRKLAGNQYFQFGKQFKTKKEWRKFHGWLKNEMDLFQIWDDKEAFQVLKGFSYYRGLKPTDISILSFDIETTGLKHDDSSKLLLISNTFRNSRGQITKKLFAYDDYSDEGEMIKAWCSWVREMNPSILTGHNINGYDLHYIKFIADKFEVPVKLGRNSSVLKVKNYREAKFRKDGSQDLHYFRSHIYGREIVDSMFLSYKYDIARNFPSYGLKPIIKYLGLESANRTFYDASQIRYNYQNPIEWAKIKEYCKDDSDDALKLFDLMAPAQFYLANSIPKSFQALTESATGSQLNSFLVRSYLQQNHSIPKASEPQKVKGGISFGVPGIYRNVLKVDLKSAYPSQILRFKLFDPEKDPQANFYKMVHHFTYERFALKDKFKETGDQYYSDREQASKIVINSAYGLQNTPGLNFNNSIIANKITEETRNMIELSLKWASGKGMEFYKQYMKEEDNDL